MLNGIGAHVLYKKKQIKGGRYLYAFKDAKKAAQEEAAFLAKAEGKAFDTQKYDKQRAVSGVIVFESDQDLDPRTAYLCYDDRWLLELVFNQYKSDECLDQTGVQGDFSVIGAEFVNFISTVATCRIVRKARQSGLLDKMTYGDLMDDLSSAWRRTDAPAVPKSDDGCLAIQAIFFAIFSFISHHLLFIIFLCIIEKCILYVYNLHVLEYIILL